MSFFAKVFPKGIKFHSKRLTQLFILLIAALIVSLAFQNCSEGFQVNNGYESLNSSQLAISCIFNGQELTDGASTVGYTLATVPFGVSCNTVQTQVSCTKGILSNPTALGSCSVLPAASCNFNGQMVTSGTSVKAYQAGMVPFGSICVSEMRACSNGVLSGTYTFTNCSVGKPASCTFNGKTLANGATAQGYTAQTVPFGKTCDSVKTTVTCNNGALSPATVFPACSVAPGASCAFKGVSWSSGQSTSGYTSRTVPYGSSCASVATTVTCTNGVLNPANAFGSCSMELFCTPNSADACMLPAGSNGVGERICISTGTSYGACKLKTCNTGYSMKGGVCVADLFVLPSTPLKASAYTSCANVSGALKCWGTILPNASTPTPVSSTTPKNVPGFESGVEDLSLSSGNHMCVIKSGTLWCWGYNNWGQVGNGSVQASYVLPTQVTGLPAGVVTGVTTSHSHSCAIVNSNVWCWGNNRAGQLGTGDELNSAVPVQPLSFHSPRIPITNVQAIASNDSFLTCALSNGDVICWGLLGNGSRQQLGYNGDKINGIPKASAISIGIDTACALAGTDVYCWGPNAYGGAGPGNTQSYHIDAVKVPGLGSVKSLAVGGYSNCAILTDGSVKCWGVAMTGQMMNSVGTPRNIYSTPTVVGWTSGVQALSLSFSTICAVVNGGAQCLGLNENGTLGDGTKISRTTAAPVMGISSGLVVPPPKKIDP